MESDSLLCLKHIRFVKGVLTFLAKKYSKNMEAVHIDASRMMFGIILFENNPKMTCHEG